MDAVIDAESTFELLRRARDGDAEALDRLLRRHVPSLRRWASGRLPRWARDMADTQDLVQDATLQALKHLHAFQPQREGALQAYLRLAVMNRIRDEIRRAHRRPPPTGLDESVAGVSPSPLEEAIGHEALDRYETALGQLRAEEREAVIARVELGQSYAEVAAAIGVSGSHCRRLGSRLGRRRIECRQC
jgi:RNA polymerase sigma-70 factor (ECF subfamily)